MANSYTNVGLIQQANGENSGTWGDYVDTDWDITTLLVGGVSTQSITSGDVTPANADGVADAGKSNTFVCSGTLTGNRALILPTKPRQFIVTNNCTGAFTMTVKTAAGTGIVVPQGGSLHLYCDGTNILKANDGTGLGLGTMSTQNASAVALSGGTITATTFDNANIGATTQCQIQGYRAVNTQTGTTYTLVIGDNGKKITLSNASAITLTIPTNASVAFTVGTEIDLLQLGAGQVTVSPAGGVTLNSYTSLTKIAGQYAGATLTKTASDTWLLVGNIA